jgi:hypothetical protein
MRTAAVNFSNADCEVRAADDTVRWGYVTTGGTHAIDLWLDSAEEGVIIF